MVGSEVQSEGLRLFEVNKMKRFSRLNTFGMYFTETVCLQL